MEQKIEIVRGTSNTISIAVTDANGDPYTLATGETLLFGVKEDPGDKDPLIIKPVTSGTEGVYIVELAPSDTIELEYGRLVYDVGLQSGEDYFNIIETGPFVIKPNVTKWGDGS